MPVNAVTRNNVRVLGSPDGPVVMLAHGFGCDQTLWRAVTQILAPTHRVVLFDHVGSGASDPAAWSAAQYSSLDRCARDVLEIVEELDLRQVIFVGHSVASIIGVLAVADDPTRFSKLILLTPSPRYLDDEGYRGGFTSEDIDELLLSLDSNYLGWSRSMAPVMMSTPERPELEAELGDAFCRTDPARAKVFARATFLSDNRKDLPRVALPTLVIDCARDSLAPPEVGRFVHESIPGSTRVTLDVSGHCPHVSAPQLTADAIATFVATA